CCAPAERSEHAAFSHVVSPPRRPAIPDAQPPLQSRSRSAAHLADHAHGLLIQLVIDLILASLTGGLGVRFFLRRFQELLVIDGLGLRSPEIAKRDDFIFGYQRSVNTVQPR